MVDQPSKSLHDLVRQVGRYPEQAYHFVREGLSYAADQIHGPETEAHRHLHHFLVKRGLDWNDLVAMYHSGELPDPVVAAIDAAGGCERLNRHVSGRELCWALRDYALRRWGIMARVVLESWNVRQTRDLGNIVFGFIDFDMMRKQSEDRIEDFQDVFTFDDAFDDVTLEQLHEEDDNESES